LINSNFERVFYKNYVSFSTTILNLYMVRVCTHLGEHSPLTHTTYSYDYSAAIRENRLLNREKYSQLKLLAQFLKVSKAYLTTQPSNQSPADTVNRSAFTSNPSLAVTQLADIVGNKTVFWIPYLITHKHAAYNSLDDSTYKLQLPTTKGNFSIPALGGTLRLNGRDSKIHVTDYNMAGIEILYSSREILTWYRFSTKTILVIHGFLDEVHEIAVLITSEPAGTVQVIQGPAFQKASRIDDIVTINYNISSSRTIIEVSSRLQI
ncbi:glycoside hydrolase family 35 protein, partial [Glonium stellatum]